MESAAVAALGSAVSFGVCDFLAGIAARRLSFWWVTLVSLVASVLGAWVIVVISAAEPSPAAMLWGAAAGIGAATGSSALYRGYGHGQMAVAGPLSALGAAALPAVAGALLGERLAVSGIIGVLVALPAIWLVAGGAGVGAVLRRGSADGLVSGVGFAVEFIGLARAGTGAGLWPVAVSQSTALVAIGLLVALRRPGLERRMAPLRWALLAGLLSLGATSLYFVAANTGLLTIAAILTGLYPAVTVVLAALLLRERPDRSQIVGLTLAGTAIVLIVLS